MIGALLFRPIISPAMNADTLADVTVLEHVKFVMKGGAVVKNAF